MDSDGAQQKRTVLSYSVEKSFYIDDLVKHLEKCLVAPVIYAPPLERIPWEERYPPKYNYINPETNEVVALTEKEGAERGWRKKRTFGANRKQKAK